MQKTALGRGLDALIGADRIDEVMDGVMRVLLTEITPNQYQPRREFEPESLNQLKDSIREHGILQPLLVARGERGYQLIAGERRYRAAGELGLKEVPVLIRDLDGDQDLLQLALIENIQREDLNPMETAESYRELIDRFGLTQEEVAVKVGKGRASVANLVRLLDHPPEIQELIRAGSLSFGQARTLLALSDPVERMRLARRAVAEGLSVRVLEAMVASRTGQTPLERRKKRSSGQLDPHQAEAQSRLQDIFQTKVKIKPGSKGAGKIEIEYYSDDDLHRICEKLASV